MLNNIWNRIFNVRLFITVLLLVFIPPFLFLKVYPNLAPFYFFANDSFYYFDLARYSQHANFFTYDGLYPTNGFHPLWGGLLYYLEKFKMIDLTDKSTYLVDIFKLNLLVLSLASGLFAVFCAKHLHRKWLAITIFAPGLTWLILALTAPDYLATWSYINGMETAIALLFFSLALLTYQYIERGYLYMALFATIMGMQILSRLDDVFFLIPFFFVFMFRAKGISRLQTFLCFVPTGILIVLYLIYNHTTVGIFMPISGWEKSGFALFSNLKSILKLILPVFSWDQPQIAGTALVTYSMYAESYMRIFQVLFPLILAIIYLVISNKKSEKQEVNVLYILCVGLIIKALYNFMFVEFGRQGFWYYGASLFITNLLIAKGIDHLICKLPYKNNIFIRKYLALPAYIIFSISCFNSFVNHKLNQSDNSASKIFTNGPRISTQIRALGADKFVEFEDGIIAFSANLPSIGGLGPILDPEASKARSNGKFLEIIYKRGYRIVVAGDAYSVSMDDYLTKRKVPTYSESLWGIRSSEFSDYALQKINTGTSDGVNYYQLIKLAK